MESGARSRSTSRSRVVKCNNDFISGESLDPVALLDDLLKSIPDLDVPLVVKISDDSNSITYLLSTFLSKEYEVCGDTVKFGLKRLSIKKLRVQVIFDVEILN
jgi:hypothetical protein